MSLKKIPKEKLEELVSYYNSLVPEIYESKSFPKGFELRPKDWALTREDIQRREKRDVTIDGIVVKNFRPLLTMDVEFLDNRIVEKAKQGEYDLVRNYPCGLKCPGCFSQEDVYGDRARLMSWQEVMEKIDEARELGLISVKFLGPGELFQNKDLFDILEAFENRNLPISIFTKGAELGDDELARRMYGHLGINSAKQLAQRIAEYENVRILLGFNSFDEERQDKWVGSRNAIANYEIRDGMFVRRGIVNYTEKRNKALRNLVEAGMNNPEKGQRLSLIAAPVDLDQIDEIPEMYVWAAKRNMPLVIAPTMESGPKAKALMKRNIKRDPGHEKLIDLYVAVYTRALEEGIMTMDDIRREGISSYMGTAPCNQVANGLYMRLNGRIQMCPGRSDENAVYGNVHDEPLAKIWFNSLNYAMGPQTNNWCPAKRYGMPTWLQDEVMRRIEEKGM